MKLEASGCIERAVRRYISSGDNGESR